MTKNNSSFFVVLLILLLSYFSFDILAQEKTNDTSGLLPDGTKVYKNIAYVKDGHALQKLDLYLPENIGNKPLPLVIWVHGGGWQNGSKDKIERNLFLLEKGFALASVDYRLTSDAIFPAQIYDCKAAIRYLRKNAWGFGLDANNFGLWGSSAGGHLVALLGTTNANKELDGELGVTSVSSNVQAVCDWFGPTNIIKQDKHASTKPNAKPDPLTRPEVKFIGGLIENNIEKAKQASPITHVSENDPPFLIMHGDEDKMVPLSESQNFFQLLQKSGIESELVVVEGAGHGFFKDEELHYKVIDFFSNQLKPTNSNSEWIQLFNGKDLSGWTPKIRGCELGDNYANTFRVCEGKLVVCYDQYKPEDLVNMDGKKKTTFDKFGHLFYNKPFSNYILRVEYRFVGEQIENGPEWAIRNNGLMIHGQEPSTMKKMQKFPVSLEVQLLGGNGTDKRSNLNVCTPGTNIVINGQLVEKAITPSNSETMHGDQWVTAEIEVYGNDLIRYNQNGKKVLEYSNPQYDPRFEDAKPFIIDNNLMIEKGSISIQAETAPIEFRKIELKELPDNTAELINSPFIGNWAMTLPGGITGWMTINEKFGELEGELWVVGAPKPLTNISLKSDKLYFTHKRAVGDREYEGGASTGKKIPIIHIAELDGDMINVVMAKPLQNSDNEKIKFSGKRISPLSEKPDLSQIKYAEPIELFNAKNLDGWRLTNPNQTNCWKVVEGVLFNETPKTNFDPFAHYGNLRTNEEFTDFNLQIDFNVPEGGNSGIYLRGMYEIQVVDRDSRMQGFHGVGAVFNRIMPNGNYGKVGDEWQHFDITLIDRHVTVILNGAKIIDNEPLEGCTNGALTADESLPGPIYLQGDHTQVSYRNIILRPIVK